MLHLAVNDSTIEKNLIEGDDFFGIAVAHYCLAVAGTDFDCVSSPPLAVFDPFPENNRIERNTLVETAPAHPRPPVRLRGGGPLGRGSRIADTSVWRGRSNVPHAG